jgi:two-component system, sensor histidine kinase and response regulator
MSPFAGERPSTEEFEQSVNILLVDDNLVKLSALESILVQLGQNILKARSSEEALGSLLAHDFAVIVLDVNMLGMKGFELAKILRDHPRSRHTPIIFLSSVNAPATHAIEAYALGAVDYISTPTPEILRTKVKFFVELYQKTKEVRRQAAVIYKLNAKLEHQVTERTNALQRSNEALQQFAYIASHELQEPLRTITTQLELLAQRYHGNLDAEADESINFVLDGAGRLRQLIRDLLAYSQIESKAPEHTLTDCDDVLAHVLRDLQQAIEENEAEIVSDPLPTIVADAKQLKLVFQNLLNNALKFRSTKRPRIHISATREGQNWRFAVCDNGIGLNPQDTARIFQLFQRLHTRREYPGTGIGLTICKKIIEHHGGQIWVESTLGQGATFFFTVDAHQ